MIYEIKENIVNFRHYEDDYIYKTEIGGIIYSYCKCHNRYHSKDGPAIIYKYKYNPGIRKGKVIPKFKGSIICEYWIHGELKHIECESGNFYWYNNEFISASSQEEFNKLLKLKVFW